MNRRQFLRNMGLAAGAATLPFILPTGSLFARTGSRRVNHVVFCLFAGGVRNIESVHQQEGGNLMPALLAGAPSQVPGLDPVPASPFAQPLQRQGTLLKEFRYAQGPTGHFNGHTVAITGQYTDTGLNLRQHPSAPTLFEYYRKHNAPEATALNAWWIANMLGPYPALNFSQHPGYGPQYGGNFIAPTQLMGQEVIPHLGEAKVFHPEERQRADRLRDFMNANFDNTSTATSLGVVNSPAEADRLKAFIQRLYDQGAQGQYNNPLGMSQAFANNDVYNILFAEEILKTFKPELTVVNMQDVDVCHQNFTQYCNNLRKADYAVAHLWHTIQQIPEMANDTVLIIAPEHGRNKAPNSLQDAYGKYAIDHTSDPTSREIFCMALGPSHVIRQDVVEGTPDNPVGESIDVVPTIARLLGFDVDLPGGLVPGQPLEPILV
jgi:hypothetical protein